MTRDGGSIWSRGRGWRFWGSPQGVGVAELLKEYKDSLGTREGVRVQMFMVEEEDYL